MIPKASMVQPLEKNYLVLATKDLTGLNLAQLEAGLEELLMDLYRLVTICGNTSKAIRKLQLPLAEQLQPMRS